MKEVKKSAQKERRDYFYLTIFNLIKDGKNPTSICEKLNISKQKLTYYLSPLKQNGFIKRVGYGTWEILKDFNIKQVKKSTQVAKHEHANIFTSSKADMSRGHGFMYHLKIPRISNWNRRREFLEKNNIKYKPLRNLGEGERIIIDQKKIHLKSNSIIIYEKKSYLTELAGESKERAIYEFKKTIQKIETLLDINLQINKKYQFKVCREHYGMIKNIIAKQYNKEGKKLHCYSIHGLWFLIDNSLNMDEAEVLKDRHPNPNKAVERAEGFQGWMNSQKDTEFKVTPTFILDTFNKNNEAIGQVTQNQQMFAKNIEKHMNVLTDMKNTLNSMNNYFKNKTPRKKSMKGFTAKEMQLIEEFKQEMA